MALTREHFLRIQAAEDELKAAYQAAAAELPENKAVQVLNGADTKLWVRLGGRFKEVTLAEPVRVS